jgi:hypothetical protein
MSTNAATQTAPQALEAAQEKFSTLRMGPARGTDAIVITPDGHVFWEGDDKFELADYVGMISRDTLVEINGPGSYLSPNDVLCEAEHSRG